MKGLSLSVFLGLLITASPVFSITLSERIQAQEKIERVYYNHRIWPETNPTPKPSFERMVPRILIEQKVIDSLKKSNALEDFWKRPITAEMLQAEMNRIARTTKYPEMLQELFSALDNDPVLIAEVLARQSLADRLIRNWYAFDQRFHSDTRALARSIQTKNQLLPGTYSPVTIELASESATKNPNRIQLSKEEFANLKKQYSKLDHTYLKENSDSYVLTRILNATNNQFDLQISNIPKKGFKQWWERAAQSIHLKEVSNAAQYELPPINFGSNCQGWEDVGSMNGSPINRNEHTAVWTGSEMIIWGGSSNYVYVNSGGRYNPATDTWTSTSTGINVPFPRQSHTAVWTGNEMIIWGGYEGTALNDGARYDPVNDSWIPIASASAPSARFGHKAVWTGSAMIVWGGVSDVFQTTLNSGGVYTISNDLWQATSTTNAPSARYRHTAVWTGTEMLVWGGDAGPSQLLGDGKRYNPQSDAWTSISNANSPSSRRDHTAVWTGIEMIIWGGVDSAERSNKGGRYNPSNNSWTATSIGSGVPDGRFDHTAIWTGTRMIVWGGNQQNGGETNSGASYDPITDGWSSLASAPIEGRENHTAIWSGSEMIVWGGENDYEFFQDGARYSPSSDSWVELSQGNNVPSERTGHTAVWTGSNMIIWGGQYPYLNTGAIYDLALNDWTATSTTNVPDARTSHTAVWTGTEMIVWGGYNDTQMLNTGGRYDPLSDSWQPTSVAANVPDARYDHVAIWTGSEMIVWGGEFWNTGGRYDPLTDTWQLTSVGANVPFGRENATAVWTGSEMIVWGGGHVDFPTATGGRYNPSADIWLPTSVTDVPVGRFDHTAVWTGNEMIVWGGISNFSNTYPTYTGGRYDPMSDTWQPTSNGLLLGRTLHSAVWTGSEMIIWGGDLYPGANSSVNSGGRYDPSTDSWISTTVSSNTPIGRGSHTAVWTGSKMIIWGGGFFFGLNSGGIYSPDQETISITPKTLPNAEIGTPYSQTISATGGAAPYKFFLVSGALPCGLTLDSESGLISGTPTGDIPVECPGGYFVADATDVNECTGSNEYILIACPIITFDPPALPDGEIGVSYSQTIIPDGGLAPYLFSISAGALPDGLTLNESTGVISGAPTTIGIFNFTITAVDLVTCAKSHDYSINITGPCLFCDDFEDGTMDPNWTQVKPGWSEAGGFLVGTPNRKKAIIVASPIFSGCQNCSEETTMMTAGGTGNKLSMFGWYVDKDNQMELQFKEENDKIVLKQRLNGKIVAKAKASFTIDPNVSYIVKVSYDGSIFTVSLNGSLLFTFTPPAIMPSGTIGFQAKRTLGSFGFIAVK